MAQPLPSAHVARSFRFLRPALTALAALAALSGAALADAPRVSDVPRARPAVSLPAAAKAAVAAAPGKRAETLSAYAAFGTSEQHVAAARLSGDVGYVLLSLDDGRVVESLAADHGFPPASVTKAITALYALETLGPEHRFETRLMAGGKLAPEGTLKGELALVGGGDPELDTDALAELVAQATQRGVKRLEGTFVVDASALPAIARIDPGQPEHVAYNPSVSALNLNFNRVLFQWEGQGGDRRISMQARALRHSPEVSAISMAVAPRAAPLFARQDVRGGDMGSEEAWQVNEGALNRKGQRWLPVRRPEIYAGDAFRALAHDDGLELPPPATGRAEAVTQIAVRRSRELSDIVEDMLLHSTNLTAEVIGLEASRARGASPATLEESGALMTKWAETRAGLGADSGLDLHNHSGLSPRSRVTPLQMAAILRAAASRRPGPLAAGTPPRGASLVPASAQSRRGIGGRDGGASGSASLAMQTAPDDDGEEEAPTPGGASGRGDAGMVGALMKTVDLKARRGEPKLPGAVSVSAKTGTLHYVRGLAGYLTAASGRRYAFAIFSEDLARRKAMENKDAGDAASHSWLGRAKRMEREILRGWAARM